MSSSAASKPHTFTHDELGQAIAREETRPSNAPVEQTGSPHEVWYRYAGKEMGYSGNNGTSAVGTQASIAERTAQTPTLQGSFRGGTIGAPAHADFTNSYDPLNSYNQGSASGSYRVQGGESLQQVAAHLWGDAGLWYKLAETNGLTHPNAPLIAGTTLRVPAGVMRTGHNAATFKPYDPAAVVGELSPTTPAPRKGKNCGAFGAILIAVVAVAVTVVTSGAFLAATGAVKGGLSAGIGAVLGTAGASVGAGSFIAAGAVGGAVGSAVSQGVGIATGIQDKFSFKGVALAALSGAVGGGLRVSGVFGKVTDGAFKAGAVGIRSGIVDAALRGAVGSALTQGVGVATGLQSKFSFSAVAAAGVGAGVGYGVGRQLGSSFGGTLASSGASAIANAATRSALNGSNFGDNVLAAIPDVIGQALGNALAGAIGGGSRAEAQVKANPVDEGSYTEGLAALASRYPGGGELALASAAGEIPIGLRDRGPATLSESRSQRAEEVHAAHEAAAAGGHDDGELQRALNSINARYNEWDAYLKAPIVTTDPGRLGTAIEIASDAFNAALDVPLPLFGLNSINDLRGDAREVSAVGTGAIDWLQGQYNTVRDGIDGSSLAPYVQPFLYQGDFGAAALATVGRGFASLPGAAADPVDSFKGFFVGAAGLVDGALRAENTSALTHGSNAQAYIANASGRELATVGGNAFGHGVLAVSPAKLRAPTQYVSRSYAPTPIHKNSLAYVGDTHVYAIRGADGSLYKIGESAQGVRKRDGASIRAEQQVRQLRKDTGGTYRSQIRQNFEGKADARAYETRFIQTYERLYGVRPPGNPYNR